MVLFHQKYLKRWNNVKVLVSENHNFQQRTFITTEEV